MTPPIPADALLVEADAIIARAQLADAAPVASGEARAGGPPAPGAATFSLPLRKAAPSFEIGVGPLYDVLPRPGEPEFGRRRPGDTAAFLGPSKP